jgi:hypothetical protein
MEKESTILNQWFQNATNNNIYCEIQKTAILREKRTTRCLVACINQLDDDFRSIYLRTFDDDAQAMNGLKTIIAGYFRPS